MGNTSNATISKSILYARGKNPLIKKIIVSKYLLIMLIPAFIYFIIFCYIPMAGVAIAFQDYRPGHGFFAGPWVGFKHFSDFFSSAFFFRTFRNTVLLSVYSILWGFPIPIVFALLLNEVKDGLVKKIIQTSSYLPYFISLVVVIGMVKDFLDPRDGIVNLLLTGMGVEPINFINESSWYRTIFIGSGIWQGFGWGSIIYLAALATINPTLYESADIDGATKFKKMIYITLPGLAPTIVMMLLLSLGNIMSVGFEKVILLYTPSIYDVSDVISTYTYRKGILESDFSYGSAVGLFNSVVNFAMLVFFNWLSGKTVKRSLW